MPVVIERSTELNYRQDERGVKYDTVLQNMIEAADKPWEYELCLLGFAPCSSPCFDDVRVTFV